MRVSLSLNLSFTTLPSPFALAKPSFIAPNSTGGQFLQLSRVRTGRLAKCLLGRAVYYGNTTSTPTTLISTSLAIATNSSTSLSFHAAWPYDGISDASLQSYCLSRFSSWFSGSDLETDTGTWTLYEGYGPTISGSLHVTVISTSITTGTMIENPNPRYFPGRASPPCVRSPSFTMLKPTID